MTTYLIRRILLLVPTLLGITLLTFLLVREAPGNIALMKGAGGENGSRAMTAEQREAMIKLYGLDKDPFTAYAEWIGRLTRLDLGDSWVDHRSVVAKIGERIGLTASLAGSALLISYLVAIPLGVIAAIKRGQVTDRAISFTVFVLYSIPSFAAALLLILLVAGGDYLNLLPMYGTNSINASEMGRFEWLWDRIQHMILPVICLTYGSLSYISRYARVSMLEALAQDFIRTARAKGLPERLVILHHALRNALIPIITIFALELPVLISGAVIIEEIFSLPGMGQLMFASLEARDNPTIMGITVFVSILTLLGYLLADILYVVVDPRIRYE
ncbi:MAG: ABC transporter permease [Methylacidiphilales bacterium]|nr:ABC transporter permease [Candidatus Methylacidiphilales bacterium]